MARSRAFVVIRRGGLNSIAGILNKGGCSVTDGDRELTAAYAECARIARRHYENFPVASLLLPRPARTHLAAVYAFARGADDLADEMDVVGDRIHHLDRWESRLLDCVESDPDDPVFRALGHSIRKLNIPVRLLRDLIDAFRDDVRNPERQTFEELLEYSRCSANPIGRLVLWVCGVRDENSATLSDSVCTALQLTNFWQDVGVDHRRGRVYLPRDARTRFGYSDEDFAAHRATRAFRALMAEMIVRTRKLFERGAPLCRSLRGGLALEVRLTWLGGNRILDMIEAVDYDVFRSRPRLRRRDFASLLIRAILGSPRLPRRPDPDAGREGTSA
jgi:phytoene synthase